MIHESRGALGEDLFDELQGRVLEQLRKNKAREASMLEATEGYTPI